MMVFAKAWMDPVDGPVDGPLNRKWGENLAHI